MIETIKIGTLKWHHVLNPDENDLQVFADDFHFHLLDIEDCRSKLNQRPKVDIYDDYYFMILHFPNFDKSGKFLQTKEVKIFIKKVEYDLYRLKEHLFVHADAKRDMDHPSQPSEIFCLIRCDQDIRWREVQWVMQACADPAVRIYKLQFATRKRDTDDRRVVIVTGTEQARELYDASIERILSEVVGPATADLDIDEFETLRTITAQMHPPEPRPA